jgi:hypothetical protein
MVAFQSSVPSGIRHNVALLVALFQVLTWPLSAMVLFVAYMAALFGSWILSAAAGVALLLVLAVPVVVAVAWVRQASPSARHISVLTTIVANLAALGAMAYPALRLSDSVAHGEKWALLGLAVAAYAGAWLGCGRATAGARSENTGDGAWPERGAAEQSAEPNARRADDVDAPPPGERLRHEDR